MFLLLLVVCLPLAGCSGVVAGAEAEVKSVQIERSEGSDPTREILTKEAAKRLDIQTAPVQSVQVDGAQRTVVPYSAVLYDNQGNTWVYLNPEPLTFVRHQVSVSHFEKGQAILTDQMDANAKVVTVGAAELYGAEFEFEEE